MTSALVAVPHPLRTPPRAPLAPTGPPTLAAVIPLRPTPTPGLRDVPDPDDPQTHDRGGAGTEELAVAAAPSPPPQLLRRWPAPPRGIGAAAPAGRMAAASPRPAVPPRRGGPHRLDTLLPTVLAEMPPRRPRIVAVPVAPLWQESERPPTAAADHLAPAQRGRAAPRAVSAAARIPSRPRPLDTRGKLPPAQVSGVMIARGVLEVLTGRRRYEQLEHHCAPEVLAGLRRSATPRDAPPARVLVTHICEPTVGAAEIAVVFRHRDRVRAMTLRLDAADGHWQLTDLRLG